MVSSGTLFFCNSAITLLLFTSTSLYVVVFLPMNPTLFFPTGYILITNLSFDKNQVESLISLYSWIMLSFSTKLMFASLPRRRFIFWIAKVVSWIQASPSKVFSPFLFGENTRW